MPLLSIQDMRKVYRNKVLDQTISPLTLQNKVQLDIRFFFCRHANENIDKFTKGSFAVETDTDTGLKFVTKAVKWSMKQQ